MNNVLKDLMSQFGDKELEAVSNKIGADKSQAANALQGVLPTLLGAMAGNAQNESGASGLLGALDRDHDGSILDDVAGFVTNADNGPGAGILKHVLGGNRSNVENKISQQSGLSSGAVGKLFEIAAPLVMGYLGKQKRNQSGFDAGGIGGLLSGLANQANNDSSFDLTDVIGMFGNSGNQKGGLGNVAGKLLGGLFGK